MRGSSLLISSCNELSSSANRIRKRLRGLVSSFVLFFMTHQGQSHAKFGSTAWARTLGLDVAAMILNDAISNGESQSCSLSVAASSEEGFKEMFFDLIRHATTVIG